MASATSLSSKGIAYALLAVVGTVTLYLFGFSRGVVTVKEAAQERANNQVRIEALQKKIGDLKTLDQQFAVAQDQVNALTVAMPADKQIAEVVAMLETMAARAGLVLEDIQTSAPTADGLPVAVTVRGDYGRTLTFVEIMEKNVRPIHIGPLSISAGENDLSSTFNIVVLYQVPPEDFTPEIVPEAAEGS